MRYEKKFKQSSSSLGKVVVLLGGISAEREVSLQSGNAVVSALIEEGVDVQALDVTHDIVKQLPLITCDRVFIALHGAGGEDGKIQALLEWLKIPYTGSGVMASAIAMNKRKTKLLWQGMGLPTPNFARLEKGTNFREILASLGGECFIKPANEGSSIGMRCVSTVDDLTVAYEQAAEYDQEVIAETRIRGREFTVTILNGMALSPIELIVKNDFYDYEAKYLSDETQYICPCDLPESEIDEMKSLALQAFDGLGCNGWGRIDFMRDDAGKFYMLEANTVPGMTSHSLVPMAAKEAGLSFSELLKEILVTTL